MPIATITAGISAITSADGLFGWSADLEQAELGLKQAKQELDLARGDVKQVYSQRKLNTALLIGGVVAIVLLLSILRE